MSEMKKQQPDTWRAEASREERKARLAAMKSKTGTKRPIRLNSPLVRTVVVVIVLLAVLAYGAFYAVRAGLPTRMLTAATIGDQSIKGSELNFYYYSIANQYGISPATSEGRETLSGPSNMEGFKTLSDYIKDAAAKELQSIVMLSEKAKAEGMALSEESQTQMDDYFSSAEAQAASQQASVDSLFVESFGPGMSKDAIRPVLERILLANQYSDKVVNGFSFSADQLKSEYEANKDTYDVVTYRSFLVNAEYPAEATEEIKGLAMTAAKAKAEKMLGEVSSAETFKSSAVEYAADEEKAGYQAEDKTLSKNVAMSAVASTEGSAWLFDAARKAGDKAVLEAADGYEVYLFESRSRADFNHVSIRHILVDASRVNDVVAKIREARTEAERILAEYKAGEQTAEAFGKLAEKYSTDTGSSINGGLYENVAPGSMVEEFDAWIMDAARKPGDTGIVQTDFGFHIMRFEKVDGIDWEISAGDKLKSEAYEKYLETERAAFPYAMKQPGLTFVG